MRKQTQKGLLGSQRWWLVAGPGRAPHTTLPWLSGRHELRKGQVCCWGFLTGSMESASSLHIPCPPPSPVSGENQVFTAALGEREGWFLLSVPAPHTHTPPRSIFRSGRRLWLDVGLGEENQGSSGCSGQGSGVEEDRAATPDWGLF